MIISFDTKTVEILGNVNDTIMLTNIFYWVTKNKANKKNFKEGRYWTYNSYRAFEELFPFFTARQIRYSLNRLKDEGYILTGNFNKHPNDNTLWYTMTEKGLNVMGETEANGYLECDSPYSDEDENEAVENDSGEPESAQTNKIYPSKDSPYLYDIEPVISPVSGHDKNVKSLDKIVKEPDEIVKGCDKNVKESDKFVKALPKYNTYINTKNKQQQTERPLSYEEATNGQDANVAAVVLSNFISNRFDDYTLCTKMGIDPIQAAQMVEQYGADVVHKYLCLTSAELASGRIKNPTGWFLCAVQKGYELRQSLSNTPPEITDMVIQASEKALIEQINQEIFEGPPITPDNPFYKYLENRQG